MSLVVEAVDLTRILLLPLRAVKNAIDSLAAIEESVPFLRAKVSMIEMVLGQLQVQERIDKARWQLAMTMERWQGLANVLKEVAKKVEKSNRLMDDAGQRGFKADMKRWFRAKYVKASLDQAHEELDGVAAVLTTLQVTLFGEDAATAASNSGRIQKQLNDLMRLVQEGRAVEPINEWETDGQREDTRTLAPSQSEASSTAGEDCLRYNRKKLKFLLKQMLPLRELSPFPPRGASIQNWENALRILQKTLEIGDTLVERHRCRFNLQTFYGAHYAKRKVEMICGILSSFVSEWAASVPQLRDVHVEDKIPPQLVDDDKEDLQRKLLYVLKGAPCEFDGDMQAEWEGVKKEHEDRVKHLRIIRQEELNWKKEVTGDVWQAEYYGAKVTVKRMLDPNDFLELENFAKFFTEVMIMGSMHIPCIANLIGASTTGLLVVERGDRDLMEWYRGHSKPIPWPLKLKILREAAQGLQYVHDNEVIHRFVNSRSYMVCAGDTVKLTNFSSATTITEVKSISSRQPGCLSLWIAPEIFDGAPHTLSSDVFSFGVVMHEVASERQPYGSNATEAEVWGKKKQGEAPCKLPVDCPPALRDLMQECCSLNPAQRPSMTEVARRLRLLNDGTRGR